ncbi:MAG: hypothetical protein WC980_10550 [Candidatus Brocadiia bacterium]
MAKKIFLIVANLALIVLIIIIFSMKKTIESTRAELKDSTRKYESITVENKQLLIKAASLEQKVAQLQVFELESARHKAGDTGGSAPATSGTGAVQVSQASSGGVQPADSRLAQARQLGKILALVDPEAMENGSPSPETLRQFAELLKIMADLGMSFPDRRGQQDNFLSKLEGRQILANIVIGAFEELKKPLSGIQISQYEKALEKLSALSGSEQATATEGLIARIQNSEAIESVSKEIKSVFTEEQQKLLDKETLREPFGIIPETDTYVYSHIEDVKDAGKVSDEILEKWYDSLSSPAEADKDVLKPLSEQYVRDYIVLRNSLEGRYGKNVMDAYLSRNKTSAAPSTAPSEGGNENNPGLLKNYRESPEYTNAVKAMNIEFLQLINRYDKEISSRIGSDRASSLMKREGQITHFPNVN